MKYLLLLALVSSSAMASITIPSAPSSPSGFSEIRTSDGATCRSSVGGPLQVYGGALTVSGKSASYYDDPDYDEMGGFVGFAYSFGGGEAVRCDRLAEIETERALLELNKLKAELAAYKEMAALKALESTGDLPEL